MGCECACESESVECSTAQSQVAEQPTQPPHRTSPGMGPQPTSASQPDADTPSLTQQPPLQPHQPLLTNTTPHPQTTPNRSSPRPRQPWPTQASTPRHWKQQQQPAARPPPPSLWPAAARACWSRTCRMVQMLRSCSRCLRGRGAAWCGWCCRLPRRWLWSSLWSRRMQGQYLGCTWGVFCGGNCCAGAVGKYQLVVASAGSQETLFSMHSLCQTPV